ncbi:MAG TPA: VWA domain-containing protein [Candidatus Polarisedimenticolia bacterium]|jgi:Ca-activated chloride channel family protein
MRFARPELLWALLLLPVLAFWLAAQLVRRRRALREFAAEPLLSRLVRSASMEKLVIKSILLVVAALFLILAACRPQWGSSLQQVTRQGVDVLLAIDVSESMLAEDIKPSRLAKAIEESSRLLDRLTGDRVGLVAFAGAAGVACPLTLDYNAVRIFLDDLSPDMISYPGTSIAEALRAAAKVFGPEQRKFKVMVILSDGEEQVEEAEVEEAAKEAASQGLVIHALGVGTPSGGPIPIRSPSGEITGYKKDQQQRVVTTRLDETLLARLSELTGGRYLPATAAESELDHIAEEIAGMDKKEMQARLTTQYEERFQIPLAIGLAALIAEALLSGRAKAEPREGARDRTSREMAA